LSFTRRACVLAVMVGLVPAAQADETKAPPTKPGTTTETTATRGKATAPAASAKPPTAAKPAPAPEADDELLEFLGSVDEGDVDWIDYLSQTDIGKVATGPGQKPAQKEDEKK
jgi:hypothetical protein